MVRANRGQISSDMALQPDAAEPPAGAAPRLLIDGRTVATDGIDPTLRLLGLSLLERIVLAARRSGYGSVFVLADATDIARFRASLAHIADVEVGGAPIEAAHGRTVCVPAAVIGERYWLEAAAEVAVPDEGSMALGSGIVVCGQSVPLSRASALAAQGGTQNAVLERAPLRIAGKPDLAIAEQRLVRSLGK